MTTEQKLFAPRIHTDEETSGEYIGGNSPTAAQISTFANYLTNKYHLERERRWIESERALIKYDRMGIDPIDIDLWNPAGNQLTFVRHG
ncbi:hypothetical protein [Halegenticoccus tardaugens]|uniref:hypothetical protein n=1 Tax=Halegenticoccus tardaugens TaxID=2071624 RepID=UPI00100A4917|nr:hypothetical protein [Halegenticoccus tardaugens]